MKLRILLACVAIALSSCVSEPFNAGNGPADLNPILAHGAFFRSDGTGFAPDRAYILRAQTALVRSARADLRLLSGARPPEPAQIDAIEQLIHDTVSDPVLANALFIDWLLERRAQAPGASIRRQGLNEALRRHYLAVLQSRVLRPPGERRWTKGIDRSAALRLEEAGIAVGVPTAALSTQYADDCRQRGVPVPATVFSADWERLGTYANPLSQVAGVAELWVHYSNPPRGVCLALTHVNGDNNHLDVICLGTPIAAGKSNQACFFEADVASGFDPIATTDLRGARKPNIVSGGICSDCHAGENPFIVHPDKPAFAALDRSRIMPGSWYAPFVDPAWPQNPGPSRLLDAVDSTGRCTECHARGYAGRFPALSTDLPGYCAVVLDQAVGAAPKRTMPASGATFAATHYQNHVAALQQACGIPAGFVGKVVDFSAVDDPAHLSAPRVNGPLYACANIPARVDGSVVANGGDAPTGRRVAVSGAVLDAELRLFVNGVLNRVFVPARNPSLVEFEVLLAVGDVVTVDQRVGGALSARSSPVVVSAPTAHFPDGLPAPAITPTTVHECASLIGVRHAPGVDLSVTVNQAHRFTAPTSTGWSAFPPTKAPFAVGDVFVAQASLCGKQSDESAAVLAVAAPDRLGEAGLVPTVAFDEQALLSIAGLIYGASAQVTEVATAAGVGFSTPTDSRNPVDIATALGRRLRVGDTLRLAQSLCGVGAETAALAIAPCSALPAPRIEGPWAGQHAVVTVEAVPGVRVRVYDGEKRELGDGSGAVIELRRTLAGGEVLTVNQQLGSCVSQRGYQVAVRPAP